MQQQLFIILNQMISSLPGKCDLNPAFHQAPCRGDPSHPQTSFLWKGSIWSADQVRNQLHQWNQVMQLVTCRLHNVCFSISLGIPRGFLSPQHRDLAAQCFIFSSSGEPQEDFYVQRLCTGITAAQFFLYFLLAHLAFRSSAWGSRQNSDPLAGPADKSPRNSHHELKVKHCVICAFVLTYTNT